MISSHRGVWSAVLLALSACTRGLEWIQDPPNAVAVTTSGSWASMIYLARTDSGVIAIDLGWTGAAAALERGTRRLDATPSDVRFAFITHAHRDHIGGWPNVRAARFVLGLAELPYFIGTAQYQGLVPSGVERVSVTERPKASDIAVVGISQDTAFALGSDTLWAFLVPGHTPGSTAYLFRGILFGGDAVNYRPFTGFQGARPEMSDDPMQSRASMTALWQRLDTSRVKFVCSAHAKCARNSDELRRALAR
ncbi:MAG TPA: MBL fold metallo-hydrolase [Gemmatimonadaceae bacterium]|nr:MBL fold metallo-hydrolase [Gemmatimonadaceae bacterium]